MATYNSTIDNTIEADTKNELLINSVGDMEIIPDNQNKKRGRKPKSKELINNTNGYDDTNDESGGLADFNPPPRAEVSSKTPQQQQQQQPNEVTVDYEKPTQINIKKENNDAVQNIATAVNPRQYPMPLDGQNDFASLPKTYASDYYKQYVPYFNSRPENSNNYSMPNTKDQLLEKLNYMIHLLEEQKDEKTGHVMEEVILYSFLGVFIIFIVDSFSRGGKYTR